MCFRQISDWIKSTLLTTSLTSFRLVSITGVDLPYKSSDSGFVVSYGDYTSYNYNIKNYSFKNHLWI